MHEESSVVIRVVHDDADRPVIYVGGEVDLATCGQLRDAIEAQMVNHSTITIDIGAVDFMDSSCLNVLAQAHRALARRGGSIILRNASEMARRLLSYTGLEFLLEEDTEGPPR